MNNERSVTRLRIEQEHWPLRGLSAAVQL